MSAKLKLTALVMILISLALLYPGITQPVISVQGEIEKAEFVELGIDLIASESGDQQSKQMINMFSRMLGFDKIEGRVEVYSETRSIWMTAEQLFEDGNKIVAALVILFSVIIPLLKQLLQLLCIVLNVPAIQLPLLKFNAAVSKWSMADVYLMSLIVTFMAVNASSSKQQLVHMSAQFEVGFYYFLAYCLFSVAASSVLHFGFKDKSL